MSYLSDLKAIFTSGDITRNMLRIVSLVVDVLDTHETSITTANSAISNLPSKALSDRLTETVVWSEFTSLNGDGTNSLFSSSAVNAGTSSSVYTEAGTCGVAELNTGTASNGGYIYYTTSAATVLRVGEGEITSSWRVKLPTVPDGTDTFSIFLGISDSTVLTNNGYGFQIQYATDQTHWLAHSRASSVQTTHITSSVIDSGWHTYQIRANSAGNSLSFYVDGVLVDTITTNIPTAAVPMVMVMSINKSAGTTARSMRIDFAGFQKSFVPARATI